MQSQGDPDFARVTQAGQATVYLANHQNDIVHGILHPRINHSGTGSSMKLPIIVSDTGNIYLFRLVQEAERYLEPPDVEDGQTIVHDCEGRRLSLEIVADVHKFLGITITGAETVRIGREESLPIYGDELKQLLIDFLVRVGAAPESFDNAALEDVLDKAIQRCGFTI